MRVQGTIAALLAALAVLITACGGGDSGGGGVTPSQQLVTITTTTLAAATQGQPYNAAIAASGGTNIGFSWSVIAGALPAGLTLSSTGTPSATLTGTPTVDGTFNFTVRVTDSANVSATAALQLDVAAAPTLAVTTTSLATGQQAQPYNATITASGGSGAGYAWSIVSGALPTGILMAGGGTPSTTLAGTPTVTGIFNFTVQVTDSIGLTGTRAMQLDLAAAPTLTITTTILPGGTQGQPYNTQLVATGGSGAGYGWSVIAGALPAGVSLTATGTPSTALAGTPSVLGTFNFTVQVQDSIGLTGTTALQLVLAPAPALAITTTTLPAAMQGQVYTIGVIAAGGSGAGYTWSVSLGALPAGITLAAGGTPATSLAGTPTGTGTFNFTVRVEDSIGLVATRPLQLVVGVFTPLAITSTPTPPDAALSVAYQHSVTAAGGSTAGYVWAVTVGALPPGMTLGAAGTPSTSLAGVPTTIGNFSFTVRVTDSQMATASLAVTLIVATGAPTGAWSHSFDGPRDRAGTGVFTGSFMIQWGGFILNGSFFTPNVTNEGEVFLPQTGQSIPITVTGAPSARVGHTAVWTGSRMLVFGGRDDLMTPLGDLRSYDPLANQWATLSSTGAPSARYLHTAVWTGTEMIIWGGMTAAGTVADGGAYDPATNQWRALPAGPATMNTRYRHKAVWTGTQMIIWGGENQPAQTSQTLYDGAVYDPAGNNWPQTISIFGAPLLSAEESTVVWTGAKLLVWGYSEGVSAQVGALWDPATSWAPPFSAINQPSARRVHSSTWVGTKLYVWGGLDTPGSNVAVNDGGVYDIVADTWAPMGAQGAPTGRWVHHAFWTGREIIAWGGRDQGFSGANPQQAGAVYTP